MNLLFEWGIEIGLTGTEIDLILVRGVDVDLMCGGRK